MTLSVYLYQKKVSIKGGHVVKRKWILWKLKKILLLEHFWILLGLLHILEKDPKVRVHLLETFQQMKSLQSELVQTLIFFCFLSLLHFWSSLISVFSILCLLNYWKQLLFCCDLSLIERTGSVTFICEDCFLNPCLYFKSTMWSHYS